MAENNGRLGAILGASEKIEHQGETYQLAPLTIEVMMRWEQWLERRAWAAFDRRPFGDPAKKAEAESTLMADVVGGAYGFFSTASQKALQSPAGMEEMLAIRLEEGDPKRGVGRALAKEILEEQFETALRLQQAMDAEDPNSPRPQPAGVPCE